MNCTRICPLHHCRLYSPMLCYVKQTIARHVGLSSYRCTVTQSYIILDARGGGQGAQARLAPSIKGNQKTDILDKSKTVETPGNPDKISKLQSMTNNASRPFFLLNERYSRCFDFSFYSFQSKMYKDQFKTLFVLSRNFSITKNTKELNITFSCFPSVQLSVSVFQQYNIMVYSMQHYAMAIIVMYDQEISTNKCPPV